MSAVIERFIVCDGGCGENYGVDTRQKTIAAHRAEAKTEGWTFKAGKDYCEECAKKYTQERNSHQTHLP